MDEALVKYRISDAQVSQPYNLQTIKSVMACRRKYLERYLSEDEIKDLFESPIKVWTVKSIKQKSAILE